MQILEWVGGFLYAITTLYLLHRNNRIMQDQNQIMREQGGAARRIANERTWWKIYWPMLVMAALTVVTWSGIGYDIYDRHTYADGIHFKKQQGQIVYGKHFLNQEVELDNRFFEECT